MRIKIINVVGARPNFMKIAPLWHEMKAHSNFFKPIIVHTGQHYDANMSDLFFRDLELPVPDIYLGVGSGSHAQQTAQIMIRFEEVCLKEKPDLVLVVGDVNSTLASSVVAAKLLIPIVHVEAGLRSFDRSMPEEINRIVTDSLSDFLFTSCKDAELNLRKEGVLSKKIYFVGNVMIDTLLKFKAIADLKAKVTAKISKKEYALLTLHRPINVDNRKALRSMLIALQKVSRNVPIIFPAHPRTQKQISSFGFERYFNFIHSKPLDPNSLKNAINLIDPLPYIDFISLLSNAKLVLTDSGGIQEETTILGIPCLTLRENTERPITVTEGTNKIVGTDRQKIIEESLKILNGGGKTGRIPKLWDGRAAERIVKILREKL
jgi:UDP-N-acetylglucosamine 2-epimerase (non-hydrolysing)